MLRVASSQCAIALYDWFHDMGGSGANQLKVNGLASEDHMVQDRPQLFPIDP